MNLKLSICSILTCLVFVSSANAATDGQEKIRMRLNLPQAGVTATQLPDSLDISGVNPHTQDIEFIGTVDYYERLKEEGYPVQALELRPQSLDERYLNPDEIVQIVTELAEEYPDIVDFKIIGHTHQKRPILGVRISSKENNNIKPSLLFNGMHHAREIMTTEVTTDIMIYLVKNYDNAETPWVADWVDNLNIWVVPQVNPDGNNIVWTDDSWWRKNGKGNEDRTWGVDLNRNYPYMWGACRGSSGSKGSQTYRGPEAGSEPETQALMNLVREENMLFDISYHSYSELVLAPYGCADSYTPENDIFREIGTNLANLLVKDAGKGGYTYGTGWEILYPVDGEDMSWMYHEQNTIAYVIEINSSRQGFQPDYSDWRNSTVKRQRPGWQYILSRALNGPQARGQILNAETGEGINGSLTVKGLNYKAESPRKTDASYYRKILSPGEYELIFSADGFLPTTIGVSIGEEPLELDVDLQPVLSWLN